LREGGVHVVEFNPMQSADGSLELAPRASGPPKDINCRRQIAITGGINISSVYSSKPSGRHGDKEAPLPWRDTDVQIEGPAVAEFKSSFLKRGPSRMGLN